ncbi:MAG: hypothetical protein MUC48_14245 [Leptolyngbya sp. Prado105]|nr:hypothetical protein [Leptolyngbya sp. Prado105]
MSLQVRPMSPEIAAQPDPSRCKILESRNQYRACHIRVPDIEERLAAIVVGDRYYSFFKLVKDSQKALQIAAKLVYRGDEVAITRTNKGDVIWIHEAEVQEEKPKSEEPAVSPAPARQIPVLNSGLWKLLTSERDYQSCQIRVPDVAKPMAAIYTDGEYYGHLRMVRDQTQAIEFAERLSSKGYAARITQNSKGWAIWVLEAEASLRT